MGDEVIRVGRIWHREVRLQTLGGGGSVRKSWEEIVAEGFGKQKDLNIGEVEVTKEAVVINCISKREAVCRSIVTESGVKIGEQGGPGGGDGLHYGEGHEG